MYVSRKHSALERPALELKGFQRVALGKGEQKRVSILLRRNDMKDWNAAIENWQLEAGEGGSPRWFFFGRSPFNTDMYH